MAAAPRASSTSSRAWISTRRPGGEYLAHVPAATGALGQGGAELAGIEPAGPHQVQDQARVERTAAGGHHGTVGGGEAH